MLARTAAALFLFELTFFATGTAVAQLSHAMFADTSSATPAGTTFTIPAGWSTEAKGRVVVLSPPEADLKLGLIDVPAKDSAAVVAAGWQAFEPDFKRPLRVTSPQAPYNGWEERHAYDYETSPNEKLVVTAFAWRAGKSWLVILLQGGKARSKSAAGRSISSSAA
jgi:hypothetical protein